MRVLGCINGYIFYAFIVSVLSQSPSHLCLANFHGPKEILSLEIPSFRDYLWIQHYPVSIKLWRCRGEFSKNSFIQSLRQKRIFFKLELAVIFNSYSFFQMVMPSEAFLTEKSQGVWHLMASFLHFSVESSLPLFLFPLDVSIGFYWVKAM